MGRISVDEMCEVASAILTNKTMGIQDTSTKIETSYVIECGDYKLFITAPHGAPTYTTNKEGWIELYRKGTYKMTYAYTRYNVGRAFGKYKFNPIAVITRMRAPHFFKLLELAKTRLNGRVATIDNSEKIKSLIARVASHQK